MTVIVLHVQADGRCHGCGKLRWVDRTTQLCLLCMGLALDSHDRQQTAQLQTALHKQFAPIGEQIKKKLVEFRNART